MNTPQRQKAWELLCRYTQSDSLRKHALAVESAMRFYAGQFGEDIEYWGTVGLLHDFDYERFPDNHPQAGGGILRNEGYDEAFIRAVMSHVPSTGIARDDRLAKTLYAVDELCGFLTAVALVRPSRKIADVEAKSVIKKMKDKAFARQVSREDIIKGAEELGLPLAEHIDNVRTAMSSIADELGL
ncbi:MAG: HD domain-containing protein [candidate division Zixibacteria bacterium]|nr:HD domain-containing protein [candidate division Zixibacteria bacterium]